MVFPVIFHDLTQFTAKHDKLLLTEGLICLYKLVDGVNKLLIQESVRSKVNAVLGPEFVDKQPRNLITLALPASVAAWALLEH